MAEFKESEFDRIIRGEAQRLPQNRFPLLEQAFQRVDIGDRVRLYEQAIRQHGYRCVLTPVSFCPCVVAMRDGESGTPEVNCPVCGGLGRFYNEETSFVAPILMFGIERGYQPQRPEGALEIGTVRCTINWRRFDTGEDIYVNYWDRFRMIDAFIPVLEARKLEKGSRILKLRHNAVKLITVYTRDPVTRELRVLVPGKTVSLDTKRQELAVGNTPHYHDGMHLAVTYMGQPYYYIIDLPNQYRAERIKQGLEQEELARLPFHCMAKRGDTIQQGPVSV